VVRLAGPRTLISTLDAEGMKLALDLNGAKPGSVSYPLSGDSFHLPRGATITRITPPVIHLRLEPVARRTLPVSVRVSGRPADGYRVGQTSVAPDTVSVEGPAEDVRRLASIETVPVDIEQSRSSVRRRVRLSTDGKPLTILPDQVDAVVTIVEEQLTRDFERVLVEAKDFKGTYTVAPPSVHLRLSGPKSVIEKLKLTRDNVYLNLAGMSAGEHSVTLSFQLPPEVKIVEQKPQRFRVKIAKTAG
jgi:YbbR domain-containing protein